MQQLVTSRRIRLVTMGLAVILALVNLPVVGRAHMEHTLLTYYALFDGMYGKKTEVEPLGRFAYEDRQELACAIAEADRWCRANFRNYRPVPQQLIDNLKNASAAEAGQAFLNALRVNHQYFGGWYIQKASDDYYVTPGNRVSKLEDYSNNYYGYHVDLPFYRISAGDDVDALDVLCTATEIPDCGLDSALWEDSNSQYSKIYGLGKMPFGEQRESGQRAPFHAPMYYNEFLSDVYPALKAPYAFYRIKTLREVAKVAFASGNQYWGLHLSGLALHYVEDCTFPYHVKMLPGHSDSEAVYAAIKEFTGFGKPLHELIDVTLAEHFLLEFYICINLIADWEKGGTGRFALAPGNTRYDYRTPYNDKMPLSVFGKTAATEAEAYHLLLENMTDIKATMPTLNERVARFNRDFSDVWDVRDKPSIDRLNMLCCRLLSQSGAAARVFMRGIAPPGALEY